MSLIWCLSISMTDMLHQCLWCNIYSVILFWSRPMIPLNTYNMYKCVTWPTERTGWSFKRDDQNLNGSRVVSGIKCKYLPLIFLWSSVDSCFKEPDPLWLGAGTRLSVHRPEVVCVWCFLGLFSHRSQCYTSAVLEVMSYTNANGRSCPIRSITKSHLYIWPDEIMIVSWSGFTRVPRIATVSKRAFHLE